MRAHSICAACVAAGCAFLGSTASRATEPVEERPDAHVRVVELVEDAGRGPVQAAVERCDFDAGTLLRMLAPRECSHDEDCEVFRPRTAFEALGCCLPVSRRTFDAVTRAPVFEAEYRRATESCGFLKVRCSYPCEAAVCHNAECRLRLADGGVNLAR